VELLKQPQYQPMSVADQVISIYAGTKGGFDHVPVPQVARAEKELLQFIRDERSEIRTAIANSKELSADTEEKLKAALEEFKKRFKQDVAASPAVKAVAAAK